MTGFAEQAPLWPHTEVTLCAVPNCDWTHEERTVVSRFGGPVLEVESQQERAGRAEAIIASHLAEHTVDELAAVIMEVRRRERAARAEGAPAVGN